MSTKILSCFSVSPHFLACLSSAPVYPPNHHIPRSSLHSRREGGHHQALRWWWKPPGCVSPLHLQPWHHKSLSIYHHSITQTSIPPLNLSTNQMTKSFPFLLNRQAALRTLFTTTSQRNGPNQQSQTPHGQAANRNTLMYVIAIAIAVTGLSYAAVPLYRIFCQASGYGGTVVKVDAGEKIEKMKPIKERELIIRFNADTSSALQWNFKPHQQEIRVVPGETALAFYSACNPTDKPVTGIATYNVIPFEAGLYFNKIQCFCFEEQRLNPHEQVDMPVFFYIDPEFDEDPAMAKVKTITLSYTFFESKEGEELPQPLTAAAAT